MKVSPQLVVHEHDPFKRGLIILLFIVVLVAAGYLLYDYGRARAEYDFDFLENERHNLQQQIKGLDTEVERLRNQLVSNQRSSEIDKQAYAEVDTSLRTLQAEILELEEEIAFYRSIVAPGETATGLRIQRFGIEPSGQEQGYYYKLVLTQVSKNTRTVKGRVVIQVEGLRDGKPHQLNLTSLSSTGQKQLDFRFKYFQSFEGNLVLPEGFVASRVHIKVSSKRKTLEKSFNWPRPVSSNALQTSFLQQTVNPPYCLRQLAKANRV